MLLMDLLVRECGEWKDRDKGRAHCYRDADDLTRHNCNSLLVGNCATLGLHKESQPLSVHKVMVVTLYP